MRKGNLSVRLGKPSTGLAIPPQMKNRVSGAYAGIIRRAGRKRNQENHQGQKPESCLSDSFMTPQMKRPGITIMM